MLFNKNKKNKNNKKTKKARGRKRALKNTGKKIVKGVKKFLSKK